jgi:hypothetical protein
MEMQCVCDTGLYLLCTKPYLRGLKMLCIHLHLNTTNLTEGRSWLNTGTITQSSTLSDI